MRGAKAPLGDFDAENPLLRSAIGSAATPALPPVSAVAIATVAIATVAIAAVIRIGRRCGRPHTGGDDTGRDRGASPRYAPPGRSRRDSRGENHRADCNQAWSTSWTDLSFSPRGHPPRRLVTRGGGLVHSNGLGSFLL